MCDGMENTGNQLEPSFMYTTIMKEIFLTIDFEQKHIDEFITHCREAFAGNEKQLEDVDKLARKISSGINRSGGTHTAHIGMLVCILLADGD